MELLVLLLYIGLVLAALLGLTLLVYLLLKLCGAVVRAFRALFVPPTPSTLYRLQDTRWAAREAMDEASAEFLEDVYRQTLHDWSHL